VTLRLVLVAHAPTEATRQHRFPLDEPADAAPVAAVDDRADALTSAAARARGTAAAAGVTAAVDHRLDDWDLGAWAGRDLGDVPAAQLRAWLADPDATPHGGESLAALLIRVGGLLAELSARDGVVAAFTHPAVLRAATVHVLGAPPAAFWRADVEPLARLPLTWTAGRWNLRLLSPPAGA
jgi:broad specificity phosphatase PhoE